MRKKIIYHAVFETDGAKHDRWKAYAKRQNLDHFWVWIHEELAELKRDYPSGVVIVYAQRIKP